MTHKKEYYVVEMEFVENDVDLFTEIGVACGFENQLYDMEKAGDLVSYEDVVVCDITPYTAKELLPTVTLSKKQDNVKTGDRVKYFLIVLEYTENDVDLITAVSVGGSLSDQLHEMKTNGHIASYENVETYKVEEEQVQRVTNNSIIPMG